MKTGPQQYELWDAFLKEWPVSRLGTMSLDDYCKAGNDNSFIRWIESRLSEMGSIWGGSGFKFGIYGRKSEEDKPGGSGRSYSKQYAWYSKYGNSPEAAFEKVRQLVKEVAIAAQEADFKRVDGIDLGDAYKWKIAFHYQRRDNPLVIPVFSREHLRAVLGPAAAKIEQSSELYRMVTLQREGKDILEFGESAWNAASEKLSEGVLTVEQAESYLATRFGADDEPNAKMMSFTTKGGREIALRKGGGRKGVRLIIAPGIPDIPGVAIVKSYAADDTARSSNIDAKAPTLAPGHPAILVSVASPGALIALCDAYESDDQPVKSTPAISKQQVQVKQPLNLILYGPPGTGKTYRAIERALAVLDPAHLEIHRSDRVSLKARFDELTQIGRVHFVTFHQSFAYEDFVEGIRVSEGISDEDMPQGLPSYAVEPGVFRRIAEEAHLAKASAASTGVAAGARVWKISIDGSGPSKIRDRCFANSEMRIGWGEVGNLADPNRPKEQIEALKAESWTNQNSLRAFSEDIAVGDIVLCLKSQLSVQAVGVVTGDYRFDPTAVPGTDFFHVRPVKWLRTGMDTNVLNLNGGTRLTLKTLYPLPRISAADALSLADGAKTPAAEAPKFVLIIDEINRGNISRIFGELITLLEDSKRSGQLEALTARLPYSRREFSVPDNLYVIGTMNTADRSLTGLDLALRRRFTFEEVAPDETELENITVEGVSIEEMLTAMNERIEALLDRDHRIGHTYFLALRQDPSLKHLASVFERSVLPLLEEYFYEDWDRIRWVLNDHRKPHESQFIIKPAESLPFLFGEEVAEKLEDRRWTRNPAALRDVNSYKLITSQ
jgi:5-methylcytosine-specific restriction protein B